MAPSAGMLAALVVVVAVVVGTVQGQDRPTGLSAVHITNTTIHVYWTPPTATPTGYEITHFAGVEDTTGTVMPVGGGSTNSTVISGLNATVTYRVIIVSVNGATRSDPPTGPALAARGPGLAYKGAVFPNHGVIGKGLSGIGEDDDALYCVTDDTTCCGTPPSADCCGASNPSVTLTGDGGSGNGRGNWYFPHGGLLPSGTDPASPFRWYARWLTGAVLTNFRGTANQGTGELNRCDIRDSTGTLHQFYTCVYDDMVSCAVTSVTDPLVYSLMSTVTVDPPVFTLTCVSTGGPASTVIWARDGNNVSYDATHVLTQTVTDQLTATYSNVLTVTGSESGNYTCSVTNDRTAQPLESAALTVAGAVTSVTDQLEFSLVSAVTADPPVFTLTCASTGGPATTVTWTRDGNNVSYDTTHVLTQTVTDQLAATYSNVLIVTGREPGSYQCSVTNDRTAQQLESAALTVAAADPPSDITATRDPPTATSITVSWSVPSTGATPTGYIIHYQADGDAGSMTINSSATTTAMIAVPSTELVYVITMQTLSAMLPSARSTTIVSGIPTIYISDVRVADEGGMLVLVCVATNTPAAPSNLKFSWYFDDRQVEDGGRGGRVSTTTLPEDTQRRAVSIFTLNNVMRMTSSVEGDGGTYRCEVTNRLSRDAQAASTNVTVQFVPIIGIFPMGTFIQNVSAMPTLTCVAASTPPVFNVTIFRDGTQLVTTADNSVMYPFPAPLNLTTDNGALFECVVFNEAGVRSSRSFTLIVQAPPGDVDNNTITRELVSLTRASLSWTAPPDNNAAITYTISLCLLQANSLSSVCDAESAQDFTATEAIIEISNLVPNRWYEVTIVASNAAGSSDPSGRFILMTTTSGSSLVGFTESHYQVIESAAEVEVQVELLEGEFAVILSLFTMDGTARAPEDYDAVRRSITLSPGNNTESVSISISDDEAVEFNERFIVIIEVTGEFSDLVELTLRMAEIIILNDDECPASGVQAPPKILSSSDCLLSRCSRVCSYRFDSGDAPFPGSLPLMSSNYHLFLCIHTCNLHLKNGKLCLNY